MLSFERRRAGSCPQFITSTGPAIVRPQPIGNGYENELGPGMAKGQWNNLRAASRVAVLR